MLAPTVVTLLALVTLEAPRRYTDVGPSPAMGDDAAASDDRMVLEPCAVIAPVD